MKLILGNTFTHGSGATNPAGDHLLQLVDVAGAAPLLVLDHVDAAFHFGLLNQLAVGLHALLAVGPRELVRDQGGGVQAGQGDELPAVSEPGEAPDVGLLVVPAHGRLPVEGRGEVVRQLLVGVDGVHPAGELLGLRVVGQLGLHPDGVAVGRVRHGAVNGAVAPALEAVVPLSGARRVPVEVHVGAEDPPGERAGLGVRQLLARRRGPVLRREGFRVGQGGRQDGV